MADPALPLISPGRAHLIATGHPADGSQSVGQASRQDLVNPPSHNPRSSAEVREWIRRRALGDAQCRRPNERLAGLRQLTGTDRTGRGAAAKSPHGRAHAADAGADTVVKSICPYCAVGCGQNVYVKDEQGHPDRGRSGLARSAGAGCARRASATLQLTTGDGPRAPGAVPAAVRHRLGARWTSTRPWRWWPSGCIKTRRRHLGGAKRRRAHPPHAGHRQPRRRHAGQRGELPHQEAVHRARRGAGGEPGPGLPQLDGRRAGHVVRPRRRHHVPAGPAARRLHRHRGLELRRGAPGRVPVGDGGQGARRDGHPRRSAVHPDERAGRPVRADPGRHRHRLPRRDHQPRARATSSTSASTSSTTPTRRRSSARSSPTPRTSTACSPGSNPDTRTTDRQLEYEGVEVASASGKRGQEYADRTEARRVAGRHGESHGFGRRRAVHGDAAARRDAAAPALRLPDPQAALRRYTPEMVEQICGITAGDVPAGLRAGHAQLRAGADHRVRLRRRLDPAHRRRPVHPRRVDPAAAAGQHRPARRRHPWRCAGTPASRAPATSRRCSTCCPGYLPMPHAHRPRGPRHVRQAEDAAHKGYWANMRRLHGEPAQGLVGRRRHGRQRLLLRLPPAASPAATAPTTRCSRSWTATARATSWSGENPAVGSANAQDAAAAAWPTSTGWSYATSR